jgi:hypothetical protein
VAPSQGWQKTTAAAAARRSSSGWWHSSVVCAGAQEKLEPDGHGHRCKQCEVRRWWYDGELGVWVGSDVKVTPSGHFSNSRPLQSQSPTCKILPKKHMCSFSPQRVSGHGHLRLVEPSGSIWSPTTNC